MDQRVCFNSTDIENVSVKVRADIRNKCDNSPGNIFSTGHCNSLSTTINNNSLTFSSPVPPEQTLSRVSKNSKEKQSLQ